MSRSWPGKVLEQPKEVAVFCLFTQAGSRRVAHLVGLLCMGLGLSPRLVQLLATIPLPVLGEWMYGRTGIEVAPPHTSMPRDQVVRLAPFPSKWPPWMKEYKHSQLPSFSQPNILASWLGAWAFGRIRNKPLVVSWITNCLPCSFLCCAVPNTLDFFHMRQVGFWG